MDEKTISYRDLLVMLSGLGTCTPEKGFTSDGQIRAHLQAALQDAYDKGKREAEEDRVSNLPVCGPGSVDE